MDRTLPRGHGRRMPALILTGATDPLGRRVVVGLADHPGTAVTVVRPAVPVAEDADGWLAHGLRAAAVIRPVHDDDPPAQFVHLDDLASAVVLAAVRSLDGPVNVAPDGWIAGDQVR